MATEVDQAKTAMDKAIEATENNFIGIRTGRANPALLNGIVVNYYGAPTPLKQLATIGVPESRTLSVSPFDQSQAAAIEKAIRDSDLGVNPNRRKTREAIEKAQKDGDMSEDDRDRLYKELDAITKKSSDAIDSLLASKEKEILSI